MAASYTTTISRRLPYWANDFPRDSNPDLCLDARQMYCPLYERTLFFQSFLRMLMIRFEPLHHIGMSCTAGQIKKLRSEDSLRCALCGPLYGRSRAPDVFRTKDVCCTGPIYCSCMYHSANTICYFFAEISTNADIFFITPNPPSSWRASHPHWCFPFQR